MPYTVRWREQKTILGDLALHVKRMVEEKHSDSRGWVTLPMGLFNGGPFVWRGVDPDVQRARTCLGNARRCSGLCQDAEEDCDF